MLIYNYATDTCDGVVGPVAGAKWQVTYRILLADGRLARYQRLTYSEGLSVETLTHKMRAEIEKENLTLKTRGRLVGAWVGRW